MKIMKIDYTLSVAAGTSRTGGPSSDFTEVIFLFLCLNLKLASNTVVPLHHPNTERVSWIQDVATKYLWL